MGANPYNAIAQGKPGTVGWRIEYFPEIGSTQDQAAQIAAAGAEEGTVVIAESQTSGRGRLGRSWFSPPGRSLYLTVILRPRIAMVAVAQLSLVAGVAAAEALEKFAPGMVQLKWPNDLWLNRKKAGGIIAQAVSDETGGMPSCVLIGIGINANLRSAEIPPDLRDRATSLLIETGIEIDRTHVTRSLFAALDKRYKQAQNSGFAPLRALWQRYSALTGARVAVDEGGTRHTGVVKGIDTDGALLLDTGAGVARIMVGDVTVEGAYK